MQRNRSCLCWWPVVASAAWRSAGAGAPRLRVKVLEQAPQLGEIGAGIQLGPNAFAAFDALGIGPIARAALSTPTRW